MFEQSQNTIQIYRQKTLNPPLITFAKTNKLLFFLQYGENLRLVCENRQKVVGIGV